jgi:thermitase
MPIRAFAANGQASTADVSNAIRQVVKSGADVINMSFGLPRDSKAIRRAIEFASQQSVELIAAAGNDGTSRRQYPAMYQSVLAVGATDRHDEKADFSNFGSYLDVGAPGVGIYSAYPNGQFGWGDGTSYSAALASGVAALVLSRRSPGATQVIKATAVVCCGGQLGRGRIDALDAVNH